jgi:hypothetical protein
MTAGNTENAQAAQAVAAGKAASDQHRVAAEAQHRTTTGSDVAVEAASTPDDHAVGWFGSDNHRGPGPSPQPGDRGPNHVSVVDASRPYEL